MLSGVGMERLHSFGSFPVVLSPVRENRSGLLSHWCGDGACSDAQGP